MNTRLAFAALAALLAGCDPNPADPDLAKPIAFRCVDGVLYQQFQKGQPFVMVDATPNHGAYTPVKCVSP